MIRRLHILLIGLPLISTGLLSCGDDAIPAVRAEISECILIAPPQVRLSAYLAGANAPHDAVARAITEGISRGIRDAAGQDAVDNPDASAAETCGDNSCFRLPDTIYSDNPNLKPADPDPNARLDPAELDRSLYLEYLDTCDCKHMVWTRFRLSMTPYQQDRILMFSLQMEMMVFEKGSRVPVSVISRDSVVGVDAKAYEKNRRLASEDAGNDELASVSSDELMKVLPHYLQNLGQEAISSHFIRHTEQRLPEPDDDDEIASDSSEPTSGVLVLGRPSNLEDDGDDTADDTEETDAADETPAEDESESDEGETEESDAAETEPTPPPAADESTEAPPSA